MATLGTIQYYTASDPVYWEVDNRPLEDLAANIVLINDEASLNTAELLASRGSEASLTERLDLELSAAGLLSRIVDYTGTTPDAIKPSLLPDISGLQGNIDAALVTHHSHFEARAEAVRKVTPSGFSNFGGMYTPLDLKLSETEGLEVVGKSLRLGRVATSSDVKSPEITINGVVLKISGTDTDDVVNLNLSTEHNLIGIPNAPSTGARQDFLFVESWKEEVHKDTGLFFTNGNTQYSVAGTVDGAPSLLAPTGYTGSAYFTPSDGVYAIEADSVTDDFLRNPDNNAGVLENGNYFQVRYRIRVISGVDASSLNLHWTVGSNYITPQGQLATPPSFGSIAGAGGIFAKQDQSNVAFRTLNDVGVNIGGKYLNSSTEISSISGLSQDGLTYAVPICAIHRRNTGFYSLGNHNGSAVENGWIVTKTGGSSNIHGLNGMSLVTVGTSTFKVVEVNSNTWKLARITGSGTPTGTATWDYSGASYSETASIDKVDDGSFISNSNTARPDSLFSDIIDRRDVLDLRREVSLSGEIDADLAFSVTEKLLLDGDYRQEWGELEAYDNDGNGIGLVESGIHQNIILESLGLGSVVPDAGANTDVSRKLLCNNGLKIGFNGQRTRFSDAEGDEDFTCFIEDQADGTASKTHASEDSLVSYNATAHTLEADLSLQSCNAGLSDLSIESEFLPGSKPSIKWGNGADIAGVLTKTSTQNWNFEIKEFGSVRVELTSSHTHFIGDVYQDSAGNNWEVLAAGTSTSMYFLPVYSTHDGDVLPIVNTSLTLVTGLGANTTVHAATVADYVTLTNYNAGQIYPLGYSLTEHETSATESIFSTYKILYKAGSSCLPQLPYKNNGSFRGAKLFIDGDAVELPTQSVPMGELHSHAKEIQLTGFFGKNSVLSEGVYSARPSTVLVHNGVYKMWYQSTENGGVIMYAESSDGGITWEKIDGPEIGGAVLAPDVGSGNFDADSIFTCSVILDGSTYKMIYHAIRAGQANRLGYATSVDGKTWVRVSGSEVDGSVLALGVGGKFDDVHTGIPSVIKDGATYKLYYSGHNGSNWKGIGYATSSDMLIWTKQNDGDTIIPLGSSTSDDVLVARDPCVIKDGNFYKMMYAGADSNNVLSISHAFSSDGLNWIKNGVVKYPGVKLGLNSSSEFDYAQTYAPKFIKDDKSYKMWYAGSGATWKIGYAVLAMSDVNNTGSSLTGVYTNASPQVNFGFKANDTVIVHYDRLAIQPQQSLGHTFDMEPKTALISSLGTGIKLDAEPVIGRDFYSEYSQYATNFGYEEYMGVGERALNGFGFKVENSILYITDGLFTFDISRFTGRLSNITDVVPSSINSANSQTFSAGRIDLVVASKLPESLEELANISSGNGSFSMSSLSVIKTNKGGLYLGIGTSNASGVLRLSQIMGIRLSLVKLIGNPLVK